MYERIPMYNFKEDFAEYEKNLLIKLNDDNKTLKEKIRLVKKAAVYLNKGYLYYLLCCFLFEDSDNFNEFSLNRLLFMLKNLNLDEKYDKKRNKLFIEIYIEILSINGE